MQQSHNSIVLYRAPDVWCATWLGPRGDEMEAVLGTRNAPTSFRSIAHAGDVAKAIKALNPDVRIGIRAAEFGPATVRECARRGLSIVWLKG